MGTNGTGPSGSGPVLACVLAAGLIAGCGSSEVRENRPPTVELTAGPMEGEVVSYSVEIAWEGTDPDGMVQRFEYALDPPAVFTEEEIAGGGPGVTAQVVPGSDGTPDVTRITKIADGEPVSFDWVHTTSGSRRFVFHTADAESISARGVPVPTGRFTGMHAVYVRAVDDDQAASLPDHVAFTAETVAPEAEVTRPVLTTDVLTTGPRVAVAWRGSDPDGPIPVSYLYKLLRVDTLDPPRTLKYTAPRILFEEGGSWRHLDAEERRIDLDLVPFGQYVFGVRAVDEAGAEEPFLDFGRNAFKLQASPETGYPTLTLSCLAGTFSFTGPRVESRPRVQFPTRAYLYCGVACTAEDYGETCSDMRWGLDLADLDLDEGWSPWSRNFELPPITFPDAGIHVLYVQARDGLGSVTLGSVVLNVVEFTLDRDVLWVDDSFDDFLPRDARHDEFWRDRFAAYPGGVGDLREAEIFGANDQGVPRALDVATLSRYKLVVWETRGSGLNGETGLAKSVAIGSLPFYLIGGGQLWLGGRSSVGAATPDVTGIRGDLNYPKELQPGTFTWDFLKLHTPRVDNDRGMSTDNNLLVVHPSPGPAVIYNEMHVDTLKQSPGLKGLGTAFADAVKDSIFVLADPGIRGDLELLYTYGATTTEIKGKASLYHGRITALRWHDPDPAPQQGPVQWFGFPLYYFRDEEAQETLNRSLDWFREVESPAP